MLDPETQQTIAGYLARSRQMIDTGRLTLEHQDYITTVICQDWPDRTGI